jgi:large subunit ribosomal protein L9
MEVILLQDVTKLGKENEIVKVKDGFARNFLFPKKLAIMADESGKKNIAELEKQQARREDKMLKEINSIVEVLRSSTFKVGAKTGTSGKIFGSVTSFQLADAIKKQKNLKVDRKKITLPDEINTLGTYTAKIILHKDVPEVDVNFEVVAE